MLHLSSIVSITALFLQRADQQAFDEIPLQERIEQHHRTDRQNGSSHLDRFLRQRLGAENGTAALHLLDHADFRVQFKQQVLKRVELLVIHEHDGVKPVVPVGDAVEQRNRRKDGHAQRKENPERDIEIAGAVDLRSLREGGRNLGHIIAHKKQVERIEYQRWNDQRPDRVVQSKIKVNEVPRDKPCVKYHRDEKEQSEPVAVTDVLGGKRISGHGRDRYGQDGADHGDEDRDHIAPVQRRAAEQEQFVGIERQLGRKQLVAELFNAGFIGEGHHEHEQHRQDAQDGDDADQNGVYGVEQFRSGRHRYSLLSERFRLVLEQRMVRIHLLHDFVAAPHEDEADHRLVQADSHRLCRVPDGAKGTENVRVDDIDGRIQEAVVLHDGINHIEAAVHNFAKRQQRQNGHGWQHERNGDMADELPAGSAVDPPGFVVAVVNARDGGQINDEVHPEVLPDRRDREDPCPIFRRCIPVDGIDMEERQDPVQDAVVRRQQAVNNVADNDPGQEMGEQNRGLRHLENQRLRSSLNRIASAIAAMVPTIMNKKLSFRVLKVTSHARGDEKKNLKLSKPTQSELKSPVLKLNF